MAFDMNVGTLNVTAGNTDAQVQSDVDNVVSVAGVVGFQELFNASHNNIVANLAGWSDFGLNSGRYQAIAWKDSHWSLVSSGSLTIFAGGGPYSLPARYLTWVMLNRDPGANGPQKIRFVTTHFTSGANWDNPNPTAEEQARRAAWQDCWNAMNAQIDTWMLDGSYFPIVLTGDYNKKVPDMPVFASAQEWDTTGGIDHVAHIPNSKLDPVADVTPAVTWYTDHGPDVWKIRFL